MDTSLSYQAAIPLEDAASRLCRALEASHEAAALIDADSLRFVFSTARFREVLGLGGRGVTGMSDLLGRTPRLCGPAVSRLLDWLAAHATALAPDAVLRLTTLNGGSVTLRVEPLGPSLWLLCIQPDRAQHAPVDRESLDRMTGLAGRQCLQDQLEAELAAQPMLPPALLIIDIDNLRGVNQRFGADVGDEVIRQMALRLATTATEGDVLTRFSGDRFGMILPDMTEHEAMRSATCLSAQLALPYSVEHEQISLSASIGVMVCADEPGGAAQMLNRTALALRHAKHTAGHIALFEPQMAASAAESLQLDDDLRRALPLRQFVLHYQPLVELKGRRLIGFEALLRWNRPGFGMVPPGRFIPAIERLGLIEEIGAWVLHCACAEAALWPAEIGISVNVSPMQVSGGQLLATVGAALRETGLAPERLELEITETSVLRAEAETKDLLRELRARRVRVALDDFGTGYASLAQIANFAFDRLKIDRSFNRPDGAGPAILRAAARLGEDLDMASLAEGIETEAELARALEAGCREGQGWLFGHPAPAEGLPAVLASYGLCPAPAA